MTKLRYDAQCELQFVQSYSRQLPWQLGCSFERFCLEQRHRLLSKYDVSIEARGCRWRVKKAGNISDRQFIEPVVWSVLVSMMTISSTWRSTLITGDFTSFPLLLEIVASCPDSRKKYPGQRHTNLNLSDYFKHILTSHVSVRVRSGAGSSSTSECGWRVAMKKLAFLTAFAWEDTY